MTYKTVSNNEGTHVVLDGVEIAIKPDKVSALDFIAGHAVQRAEAAEARSAELEAQLTGAATVVVTLTTERDELARKLEQARQTCERMNEIIKKIAKEREDIKEERDNLCMSIVNNISA